MNPVISNGILLFFLVCVLVYLFSLFRTSKPKLEKFAITGEELKGLLISLAVLCAVYASQAFFATESIWLNLGLLAASFTFPFILKRFAVPSQLMQVILLLLVVLPVLFGTTAAVSMTILLGLLAYKLLDNLAFSQKNRFDDILPACIWLAVCRRGSCIGSTNSSTARNAQSSGCTCSNPNISRETGRYNR